jgi:hypothetical protein
MPQKTNNNQYSEQELDKRQLPHMATEWATAQACDIIHSKFLYQETSRETLSADKQTNNQLLHMVTLEAT